ncbi:NAD(P)H-dependent oxidoreductase [Pseudaquabacterium rugosum]|uniref:NAD(P)H-dependent oxidoreductase n=1 Tax=Pseudaquabacterium rugosum TaxID=2984194 RepID=A0ABU9BF90_9BURK
MRTLILVSHPDIERSVVTRHLLQAARQAPDTTVRHLEALYGHDEHRIDVAAEQAAYAGVERVICVFPIHWFNLTPMLKAYLNRVWTWGWSHGPGGQALRGKTMQLVVSAGATAHTYSPQGVIHATMDEVLAPMKASALYVGMDYAAPLAFYGCVDVAAAQLDAIAHDFRALLAD